MHLEVSEPLLCGMVAWRARAAGEVLTVVCKASYDLQPGECVLRAVQEPLREHDQAYGGDPRRPVYASADLVPHKPRAEVVLVGSAFAPGAVPAPSLIVRMAAAGVDKSIEVHAERRRYPNGQVVSGAPFTRASLGWDQAAAAPTNPIGVRSDVAVDAHGGVALPRLVMPQAPPGAPFVPAGFGPVAAHWPGRLEKLGHSGIHALPRSWNTATLPDDLDPQFFQVAPPDQQIRSLRADEPLLLMHMSLTHPRLATRLSGVFPEAWIERPGRGPEALALVADTLWIDTDRALCSVTWRGRLRLSHAGETGVVRVRMEGARAALPPSDPIAAAILAARERTDATAHLAEPPPLAPAMPFVAGPPSASAASAFAERLSAVLQRAGEDAGATLPVSAAALSSRALPFAGTPVPTAAPTPASAPAAIPETLPAIEKTPAPEVAQEPVRPLEVPPPMIGPLAGMGKLSADKPAAEAPALHRPPRDPAEPMRAASHEPESEPAPGELTLEQVATVAAEIAEGKVERKKVLEAHGLRERTWRENERRWTAAIGEEAARGTHTLRATYDAAYVARVEKFRGPITLEEYARIVAGLERGRANQVLEALRIQQPVLMPIARLWTKKIAKDMTLADAATRALRAARST